MASGDRDVISMKSFDGIMLTGQPSGMGYNRLHQGNGYAGGQ
jgi:hypothetical protein